MPFTTSSDTFWVEDVTWAREPTEKLRRLHAELIAGSGSAIEELKSLAQQGSMAAAIYLAMQLDRASEDGGDRDEAIKWYSNAAKKGPRASSYRQGILLAYKGDLQGAEQAFSTGSRVNFTPSMYRQAMLYMNNANFFKEKEKALSLLLEASRLGHMYPNREIVTTLHEW